MPEPQPIAGTPDDPTISFTPVVIGSRTFSLFFNLKALAKAQKATGVNFLQDGIDFTKFDADTFASLIHAGIGKAHPDTTEDQVADLVTIRDLPAVMAAVVRAFGASQMKDDPENPPNPSPAE